MNISKRTLETLIDLVEIKLSCAEVYDRADSHEVAHLKRCRSELETIINGAVQGRVVTIVPPSHDAHHEVPV